MEPSGFLGPHGEFKDIIPMCFTLMAGNIVFVIVDVAYNGETEVGRILRLGGFSIEI